LAHRASRADVRDDLVTVWGGQFGSGLFAGLLRFMANKRFQPVRIGAFLPRY
jgi:hypothetical protein